MNPVDHPMGGGEGRSSGGRNPCSPSAVPAKGGKTRSKPKAVEQRRSSAAAGLRPRYAPKLKVLTNYPGRVGTEPQK